VVHSVFLPQISQIAQMDISFILVDPSVPENIGAAARAINTMGFSDLRLVNPQNFPHEKAWHVAHGSSNILETSKIFSTLEEALAGIDFAIATSAKKRSVKYDYHHIAGLPSILEIKKKSVKQVALVFGGEESGLSNRDIGLCDIISFIPMKRRYPSLNLSHAVMLYAYTLSAFATPGRKRPKPAGEGKYRQMTGLAEETLEEISFRKDSNVYARIFERLAMLPDDDVNLVLSYLDKYKKKRNTDTTDITD
jgi:tRNA/rRNA methyltransferase